MSQQAASDFDIVPTSTSGTELATLLNALNSALLSMRSGTSLPPSSEAGTIWRDTTSATTHIVKYYNGTVSTELYSITVSTGVIVIPASTFNGAITILYGSNPNITIEADTSGGHLAIHMKDSSSIKRLALEMEETTGGVTLSQHDSAGSLESQLYLSSTGNAGMWGTPTPSSDSHFANKKYVDDSFPVITGGTFTTADSKTVTYNASGLITNVV